MFVKTFLTAFAITTMLAPLAFFIEKTPVARNGFDCEILRVAREIENGNVPDFDALRKSGVRNGETMILRAYDDFPNQGGAPHESVLKAYNVIKREMFPISP